MKNITLTVAERLYAIGLMNGVKGDRRLVTVVDTDSVAVGFTPEERVAVGLRNVLGEEGRVVSVEWDSANDIEKEVELSTETVDFLVATLEEKDKAKEFTLSDRPAFSLLEKLKA